MNTVITVGLLVEATVKIAIVVSVVYQMIVRILVLVALGHLRHKGIFLLLKNISYFCNQFFIKPIIFQN